MPIVISVKAAAKSWWGSLFRYLLPILVLVLSPSLLDWGISYAITAALRPFHPWAGWDYIRFRDWKAKVELILLIISWVVVSAFFFLRSYVSTLISIYQNLLRFRSSAYFGP